MICFIEITGFTEGIWVEEAIRIICLSSSKSG